MNQYQRIGTFIVRLVGGVVVLVGILGMIYATSVKASLVAETPSHPASFAVSAVWLAGGVAVLLSAGRLGRWLGHGLD